MVPVSVLPGEEGVDETEPAGMEGELYLSPSLLLSRGLPGFFAWERNCLLSLVRSQGLNKELGEQTQLAC